MKRYRALTSVLCVVLWLVLGAPHGWAQGATFTYQDKLTDAGNPANSYVLCCLTALLALPVPGARDCSRNVLRSWTRTLHADGRAGGTAWGVIA